MGKYHIPGNTVTVAAALRCGFDHQGNAVDTAQSNEDFLGFFAVVKSEVLIDEEGAGSHAWRKWETNACRSAITSCMTSTSCLRKARS